MKPIRDREIDLQLRRVETGFRTRALHSPAGEVSRAWGSLFTEVEPEGYFGVISSSII
jgi:hypothetical protein